MEDKSPLLQDALSRLIKDLPPEERLKIVQEKKNLDSSVFLAKICANFIDLILLCRSLKKTPDELMALVETDGEITTPVFAFIMWTKENSEESFLRMSKSFGIDFDKILSIHNERELNQQKGEVK